MRLLLTNDDGFQAEGIQVLRAELMRLGARVTTIAPSSNRSGVGRSITIHRDVTVSRVGGDDENPVYACTGQPVDCVRIGLLSELGPAPEAVVSGINHGLNLGDDLTYSGTVAAALEGALHGYPAIAFSQEPLDHDLTIDASDHPIGFPLAREAARVGLAALRNPPGGRIAVNVNLPARAGPAEIELVRPGRQYFPPAYLEPTGPDGDGLRYAPYGTPGGPVAPFEDSTGTDVAAILAGRIALSLITVEWGEHASPARNEWLAAVLVSLRGG